MIFRDLTADDIEVRVQSVKKNGAILLLYKNARVDMNILDEAVGSNNWQNRFYECKGNLFCSLGINVNYDIEGAAPNWIWKDDCGTESNTEPQKGEASDARKRAGFTWGIGRELYTSPFIWITADNITIETDKNGNLKTYDKFAVEKIKIVNKRIVALSIINLTQKKRAFVYMKKGK